MVSATLAVWPLIALLITPVAGVCDADWVFDGGRKCVRLTTTPAPWDPAECKKLRPDAELVTIKTADEQAAYGGFAMQNSRIWTGLSALGSLRGVWKWSQDAIDETLWATGEPDPTKGECVIMGGTKPTAVCGDPTSTGSDGILCAEDCRASHARLCLSELPVPNWDAFHSGFFIKAIAPGESSATSQTYSSSCKEAAKPIKASALEVHGTHDAEARKKLGAFDAVWVGGWRTTAYPTADKAEWKWIDGTLGTIHPDDVGRVAGCGYIAGSGSQAGMWNGPGGTAHDCSPNSGMVCSTRCSEKYLHLCQYEIPAGMFPPADFPQPPRAPPTPTPTIVRSYTPTSTATATPSLTATVSTTPTQSLTPTATESVTVSVSVTPGPPRSDDDNRLLILGIALGSFAGLVCLLCAAGAAWNVKNKKIARIPEDQLNTELVTSEMDPLPRQPDLTLTVPDPPPVPRVPVSYRDVPDDYNAEVDEDSDLSSATSSSSGSEVVTGVTFAAQPDLRIEDVWPAAWQQRVRSLCEKHGVTVQTALDTLRVHQGHAGHASRALDSYYAPRLEV